MEDVDVVVIGAGVVGIAVARALALAGREVIVLDKEEGIGTETSSRNSEVIHAGIYYPAGSLKARLCVQGKHALYAHARRCGVPFLNCGKLIVATAPEQIAELEALKAKGAANGVPDLEMWTADRARALEPNLACVAALWSPSTGVIDSHALMLSFLGEMEDAGGMLALNSPVDAVMAKADGFVLSVGGADPMRLKTRILVNAAGLHAPALAGGIAGLEARHVPRAAYAKGNYYTLAGRSPFSRLIYPVPEPGGLGVHVTIDLAGQTRFGPDVEWLADGVLNYDVDPGRAYSFYAAVRRYWPDLPDGALLPGYAGIRPKLGLPGDPASDFVIQDAGVHGLPGLVNLFGIESPGLTATLAIAEEVAARLD
jgi:L-2-hydroxyglutarate oxidase LhgO